VASAGPQPGHGGGLETMTCHFCRRADLWLYLTCGVCQLTTHAKCYYRLGSDEATYYETHSSDWRCQDCGGPQRHADCVISSDEQVIQRHVGPRLSNRGYPASGDDGVAAGAAKNLRSDCVLSDDGQIADFRPTTGGLLSSERGGGAASPDTQHVPEMDAMHIDVFDNLMPSSSDGNGPAGADPPTDRPLLQHGSECGVTGAVDTSDQPLILARTHFGKPRPPRPKKKPPVRDKTSHHQRRDAAGQGTRPSAQSKH